MPCVNECSKGYEGFLKRRKYVGNKVFWFDVGWEMVEVQRSSMGALAMCSVWKFGSNAVVCLGFV